MHRLFIQSRYCFMHRLTIQSIYVLCIDYLCRVYIYVVCIDYEDREYIVLCIDYSDRVDIILAQTIQIEQILFQHRLFRQSRYYLAQTILIEYILFQHRLFRYVLAQTFQTKQIDILQCVEYSDKQGTNQNYTVCMYIIDR